MDRYDKVSWFLAPTITLCEQQREVIARAIPVPVGIISGNLQPDEWKDRMIWQKIMADHRVVVSTPQVLVDALRHSYVNLGLDINLLVFDEAHHAVRDHPYSVLMREFYFRLPARPRLSAQSISQSAMEMRPSILGLTASPVYGGKDMEKEFK